MRPRPLAFMDASSSLEEADYVLFGVMFDETSSFRRGSKWAPPHIRMASYNLESFSIHHEAEVRGLALHDAGDFGPEDFPGPEEMVEAVSDYMKELLSLGKCPIALGGEHTITIAAARALRAPIIYVDAHADFREEYMGRTLCHACQARRAAKVIGVSSMSIIGVRSISAGEYEDAVEMGLRMYYPWDLPRPEELVEGLDRIYLSIDLDGLDPSIAPGVSNPEPGGLDFGYVRDLVRAAAPRAVGMDVVEGNPLFDNGNTMVLAAKLVQEFLLSRETQI